MIHKHARLIQTYTNKLVRAGQQIKNVKKHTAGLIAFVYDKLKADIDKVKQAKTKASQETYTGSICGVS